MATCDRPRGPVGQAAAQLKDALSSKFSRRGDSVDQALNDALFKALSLVTAFLKQGVEQEAALETLKAEVRHTLLNASQAQATCNASAPPSQCSSHAPPGRPLFPHLPHKGRTAAHDQAAGGHRQARQLAGRRSADRLPSMPPRNNGAKAVSKSAEADWTLPQRLLQTKAFVHSSGSVVHQSVLKQDELAWAAEAERRRQEVLGKERTRAVYDQQMDNVHARREAEVQDKAREGYELQQLQRRLKEEEQQRRRQQREAQERTRQAIQGQVDEVRQRREHERQQQQREAQLVRQHLQDEQRREQTRKKEQEQQNRELREGMKRELEASMAEKERAALQRQEDEQVLAEREARRLAALAERAERQKRVVERAGGVAIMENVKERERLDAERTERLRLEKEAKEDAVAVRRREHKQSIAKQQAQALNEQIALHEAERQRQSEAQRRLKAQMDKQLARERREEQERKQQLCKSKEQQLQELKASLVEDRKRRHDQHLQRIPDSDSWVHVGVLQGRDRGFVNLTVPQAYMASMQGTGAKAHNLPVPAQS